MIGDIEHIKLRSKVEVEEKWREWCSKIPKLHFKEEWEVTIIPPFARALTRFYVDYNSRHVSVYFNGYSQLGYMYDENNAPIPYFETYYNEETRRYYIDETDCMMKDIEEYLNGENE